ncbi:MAG: FAD-binding and (Fe-S)-binding domain-containing protein, partial [Bacteroidota bacterium]
MLDNNYQAYYQSICRQVEPERIFTDEASTLAYGTDASFYRMIPQMVIQAKSVEEVSFLLQQANRFGLSVTFRAAGTSLSGQAITDSILILAGFFWKKYQVLDEGKKISLQPGVLGAQANLLLKPYGRKIGPDPASINAAMIGGIAANNASGMCCGTAQNSYKTLHSMKILFYDGFLLDTACSDSIARFKKYHAAIYQGIDQLGQATKANDRLAKRIREKYKMKNTTGYSLNALVDFSDPVDIIAHLLIGSEGTLGMIAEITYHTVEDFPHKASALIIYDSLEKACNAVSALKSAPVDAVELMDRASLRSVENMEGVPDYLPEISREAAALLVEIRSKNRARMEEKVKEVRQIIDHIPTERPFVFTDEPEVYGKYWKIRKGLFPSVGAIRKIGTSVIIEDITFPIARLAAATLDLQDLFRAYDYHDAVVFGHALEGNLHFVFTQDFAQAEEVARYDAFMRDLADLVVDKYDGALKAEHGTGRNMAPFVEKEWGKEAYDLMRAIKNIFDPQQIINPGVIINEDDKLHIKNLKPLPAVNELIDKCIECGFCEPTCLSHSFTFSPRQRIVIHREMSRLRSIGKQAEADKLKKATAYQVDQTCSADGLCALACPVKIDTGVYTKKVRQQKNSGNWLAQKAAQHLDKTTQMLRAGMQIGQFVNGLVGPKVMDTIARTTTGLIGQKTHWSPDMPQAMPAKRALPPQVTTEGALKVVYFTTCINRTMGAAKDADNKESVF